MNKFRRYGLLLLSLCLLAQPARAWHAAGHMATALVAYDHMDPAERTKAIKTLRDHPRYDDWMSAKPASIPEGKWLFMKAAVWPDDIRSKNHPDHEFNREKWHYFDKAVRFDGGPDVKLAPPQNLRYAILLNETTLQGEDTGQLQREQRARAICWLMHLWGDVHQPLHMASLIERRFPAPEGDRGGNSFWVRTETDGITNLHSLWDGLWDRATAIDRAQDNKTIKTSDLDVEKVPPIAEKIDKKFQNITTESAVELLDVMAESYKLAVENVYLNGALKGYAGVGEKHTKPTRAPSVPADYEKEALKLGERQIALGGIRLAHELELQLH